MRRPTWQSQEALMIRCQPVHLINPSRDFINVLRSTIYEVEIGVGIDVYIVVDVDETFYPSDEWILNVDEEFRRLVLTPFAFVSLIPTLETVA